MNNIVNGSPMTFSEAARVTGISTSALRRRVIDRNISLEDAMYNWTTSRKTFLKGSVFGYLTCTGNTMYSGKHIKHEVVCLCGRTSYRFGGSLTKKAKNKASCCIEGCKYSVKHGHGGRRMRTKEYTAWVNIKSRCYNKESKSYPYYGGIGITMSEEFNNSFMEFYNYIGDAPSKVHSVDRIDVTKGYEKGNIRWSTKTEQSNNQRRVNDLTHEVRRLMNILDANGIKY